MEQKTEASQAVKFRKKPVEIEAIQWPGDKFAKFPPKWFSDAMYAEPGKPGFLMRFGNDIVIHTLEGQMKASPGDWIIRGVKGEIYPCKPDIFELTYEDAALKAQPAPTEAQGEWQLVPVELTDDMLVAFADVWYTKVRAIDDCEMADCYAAMLAAAPEAPSRVNLSANFSAMSVQPLCSLEVQGEDSARLDAALIKAREWIVKNRPALTLSRAKTIDEYMGLLDTIDRARASAETGGVKP